METYIAFGIIGILSTIFLIIGANANRRHKELYRRYKELDEAKNEYFQSLNELKNNPNNPDIRQNTLYLGRKYSDITRNKRGVTIYDEMALMNDINAACAGATAISENAKTSLTIENRLTKLSELKEKNLISEAEYEIRKQKILDEI